MKKQPSDMNLSTAVAEVGKWGNLIRALSRLTETAEFLENQSQAVTERERALKTLSEQIVAAQVERDSVVAEGAELIAKAKADARQLITAAEEAVAILNDQRTAIAKELADAKAHAAAHVDIASKAKDELKAAQAELRKVREEIETLRASALKRFGG